MKKKTLEIIGENFRNKKPSKVRDRIILIIFLLMTKDIPCL